MGSLSTRDPLSSTAVRFQGPSGPETLVSLMEERCTPPATLVSYSTFFRLQMDVAGLGLLSDVGSK